MWLSFGFVFLVFSILVQKIGHFRARIRNLREKSSPGPAGNVWKPKIYVEYDENKKKACCWTCCFSFWGGFWSEIRSGSGQNRCGGPVGIVCTRFGTPWSLNRLFKAILNSLFDCLFFVFSSKLPPNFLPNDNKNLQNDPQDTLQIVSNTPKMPPENSLKKSLNRLFIDPGVQVSHFSLCVSYLGLPKLYFFL